MLISKEKFPRLTIRCYCFLQIFPSIHTPQKLNSRSLKVKDAGNFSLLQKNGRILKGGVIPLIFPIVPQSSHPESLGFPRNTPETLGSTPGPKMTTKGC